MGPAPTVRVTSVRAFVTTNGNSTEAEPAVTKPASPTSVATMRMPALSVNPVLGQVALNPCGVLLMGLPVQPVMAALEEVTPVTGSTRVKANDTVPVGAENAGFGAVIVIVAVNVAA